MKDRIVKVLSNDNIGRDIFKMTIQSEDFPSDIKGGQFINIALPCAAHLLRRPFCIAEYSVAFNTIQIVYAVVGEGTLELSRIRQGAELKALFPLGNGFDISDKFNKIVLLGGGLGAAILPAIPTAWRDKEYYAFMGFASADKAILVDEMVNKCKETYISTDDGSMGEKGFVTDLLVSKIDKINPDVILCCGPEVMYKSLAKALANKNIPIFVSLEKRMGCGIGACLVCNCKIKTADGEKFLRACVDGPVFNLSEVIL